MWITMNDNFLSQEEIDSLLNKNEEVNGNNDIDDEIKDLLGEVGNISMATAATALSTILGKQVMINTPKVEVTDIKSVTDDLNVPVVVLQVEFSEGLKGNNILALKIKDASIIANLMMGGDGTNPNEELSEIEMSAISEAMNQMIGSASTAMSTMINGDVNITPPNVSVWDSNNGDEMPAELSEDTEMVKTSFNLTVEGLIDSEIMQLFTMDTVDEIVDKMTGGSKKEEPKPKEEPKEELKESKEEPKEQPKEEPVKEEVKTEVNEVKEEVAVSSSASNIKEENVTVQKPQFAPLKESKSDENSNLDLILDVPLELSVILGRSKKSIKEVLALSPGSIVELNKFAEEPLEIYANGKLIAQGEVVVINENFGIRITNILSARERVKTLK
ncbi:MAG: flagellar motor switch phosphatase FliY [Firmicutes bacterium]|nr:flagellar motor switch phosphatase FliY [Bacillota bacterium]